MLCLAVYEMGFAGPLDTERIKAQVAQHVLDRRDKNGALMFPRLRHLLVSCWGNYAWDVNVTFRPENHLLVANAVYRGRQVGDNNIQVKMNYAYTKTGVNVLKILEPKQLAIHNVQKLRKYCICETSLTSKHKKKIIHNSEYIMTVSVSGVRQRYSIEILSQRPTTMAVHHHTLRVHRAEILHPSPCSPSVAERQGFDKHRRSAACRTD